MPLIERIHTVRQRLRDGSLTNEASVSIGVVLPILDALGWTAFDTSVVRPEYPVGTRRVDFALMTHGRPAVFVEVKQPGLAGQADRQLFEYAFHEGVPIAILTDGATWHVYLPAMQGSYDDRRVYLLDLLERDPEESADRLQRYLSRDAVESGDAFERAQTDYRRSRQRKGAEAAIPQAWANLVAEPRLADLLAAEVESVCGYQPEATDLATFLASLRPTTGALPAPAERTKTPLWSCESRPNRRPPRLPAGRSRGRPVAGPAKASRSPQAQSSGPSTAGSRRSAASRTARSSSKDAATLRHPLQATLRRDGPPTVGPSGRSRGRGTRDGSF